MVRLSIKIFYCLIISSFLLTSCGDGEGLSSNIEVFTDPPTPVVINTDLNPGGEGADRTAPWFSFRFQTVNNSAKTLVVNALDVRVYAFGKKEPISSVTFKPSEVESEKEITVFHVLLPGERSNTDLHPEENYEAIGIFDFALTSLPRIPEDTEKKQRFDYKVEVDIKGFFSDFVAQAVLPGSAPTAAQRSAEAQAMLNPSDRFIKSVSFSTK